MQFKFSVVILSSILSLPISHANSQIWFSPIKSDFLSDREQDAHWENARKKIDVFKFYYQAILQTPNSELREKMKFLRANNIAVAIEWPALTWKENGMGYNIEGFAPADFSQMLIEKIKASEGRIDYIAMDEVLYFGSIHKGRNYPNLSVEQIATQVALNLKPVKAAFPNVKIGDIEPIDQLSDTTNLALLSSWLEAFEAASGKKMDFIHYDVFWANDWKLAASKAMNIANQKGIRFGVIFNGEGGYTQDYSWMMSARKNINRYMSAGITLPDDVIFQSWNSHPKNIDNDNNPSSHASLIQYFFAEKTAWGR